MRYFKRSPARFSGDLIRNLCARNRAMLNQILPRVCYREKHREWVEKRVHLGSVTAGLATLELPNLRPTSLFLT